MRKHKQRPFGLAYYCVIVLTQRSRNFLLWTIGTFNTFAGFYGWLKLPDRSPSEAEALIGKF